MTNPTIPTPENQYAAWARTQLAHNPDAVVSASAYRRWCRVQEGWAVAPLWMYVKRDDALDEATRLSQEASERGHGFYAHTEQRDRAREVAAHGAFIDAKIRKIEEAA